MLPGAQVISYDISTTDIVRVKALYTLLLSAITW